MLWLKAFHIVFVAAWFAGLFYLPRLFVYHAMSNDELKMMMLRIGVNPQKQMKRGEVIKAIRLKMEAVTISDDDA